MIHAIMQLMHKLYNKALSFAKESPWGKKSISAPQSPKRFLFPQEAF
jgi:hypothetical protein